MKYQYRSWMTFELRLDNLDVYYQKEGPTSQWQEALKGQNIRMILSSVRHPQGNKVERVNREIACFFRTFLPPEKRSSWYSHIKTIEAIINESYHDHNRDNTA